MVEPCSSDLDHFELVNFLGLGVHHVHGAAQSRIKGSDDPYDIKGVLNIFHGRSDKGLFNGTEFPLIIPGGGIPDGSATYLIIVNLLILD